MSGPLEGRQIVLGVSGSIASYKAAEVASRLMQEVGMGEGTIYPLMRRMQDDGQVSTYLQEAPGGPPRKYYRITETGRATLKAQREEWKNFMTSIEKMLGDAP